MNSALAGFSPQREDDQIRGLGSIQSTPRAIGLEDSVQSVMTAPTKRDQIPIGLISQALVAAVM